MIDNIEQDQDYENFLSTKEVKSHQCGFDLDKNLLNKKLFEYQKSIVYWALRKGKSAVFAATGLGKTFIQTEWAFHVSNSENAPVLIIAPLAVTHQTIDEAKKLGIHIVSYEKSTDENKIVIINYESIHKINDIDKFCGVVLDESSILKSFESKTKNKLIELFYNFKYKLACTATPSPNDYMELGNHAEFLGIMSRNEMLAMYFIHDGKNTSKWRLKGHAKHNFWKWLSNWSVMLTMPSDLGFEDDKKHVLPKLNINYINVPYSGELPKTLSLTDRKKIRQNSINARFEACRNLLQNTTEQFVIWCGLNKESEMLSSLPNTKDIKGSDCVEYKLKTILDFQTGHLRNLVTKARITGYGLNWQHCNNVIFFGMSDSFEDYFQAVRRCWRFGQEKEVNVYVIISDQEMPIVENVLRKEEDYNLMIKEMISLQDITKFSVTKKEISKYIERSVLSDNYSLYLGDSTKLLDKIEDNSIDYSIYSPPFLSLYVYSNSYRDLGNSTNDDQFFKHYKFIVQQLLRVIKPGRLMSVHCANIPYQKYKDGFIGLKDFRGDLIRLITSCGFIFHSEVCIWKNPVVEVTRTKALGLLHKTIKKDSSMSRQGIPDYLLTFRVPGENENPIEHDGDNFPVNLWQRYASPVWMDINQTNTLQAKMARDGDDERHICPLQLDVIERALMLWTNPKDVVLSPFAGIGSEGYKALQMGRKFVGIELKQSYFNVALKNLDIASGKVPDLYPNPYKDSTGYTIKPENEKSKGFF